MERRQFFNERREKENFDSPNVVVGPSRLLNPEPPTITWAEIRAAAAAQESGEYVDHRFDGLKPIVRSLYIPPVGPPIEDVKAYRESLNNMTVTNIDQQETGAPPPFRSFEEAFGNNQAIMAEITKNGFTQPTPIQAQMWPVLLSGRDCIGISQTGSGKTLAFLLPAFLHIEAQAKQYGSDETLPCPLVLCITPTRELAQQIEHEVAKYSYNGYKSVCLYGGGDRLGQMNTCRGGVQIVIATPGRLADLAQEGVIELKSITYVVLDEADRMLDLGFEPHIRRILYEIRPDRLTVLTSATWPENVRQLSRKYTKDPAMVVIGTLDLTACENVAQFTEYHDEDNKVARLFEIVEHLKKQERRSHMPFKMIVFVGKKLMADHLASEFCLRDLECEALHGSRSQVCRDAALQSLRTGRHKILIATDLASRGLDVPDVTKKGNAMTFVTRRDWRHAEALIEILKKSGQRVIPELEMMAARWRAKLERDAVNPRPRPTRERYD